MKDSCSVISKLLGKYFDQEVTDEERSFVDAHLVDCHACQEMLSSMEKIRDWVKAPVEEAARKEDFPWVWEKIERAIRKEEKRPFWKVLPSWLQISPLFQKKFWIPAVAAMVVTLLVTLPLVFQKTPISPSPSVVEYLESETNNVMVYDSENSKITLIWLFEEPEKEPDAV